MKGQQLQELDNVTEKNSRTTHEITNEQSLNFSNLDFEQIRVKIIVSRAIVNKHYFKIGP